MSSVYGIFGFTFKLKLSTRPEKYVGDIATWDSAEKKLEEALNSFSEKTGAKWEFNPGDGAFYGPKIDIVLTDSDGKEHQTATIQLDFQLPKRFELEYQAPAPEYEARGETTTDASLLDEYGPVRPVMIHRAVLGSVERLMALLIEKYNGKWPFWLNPRQVAILTINTAEPVVEWAEQVRSVLVGNNDQLYEQLENGTLPNQDNAFRPTGLSVDIDDSARPLGAKIKEAREKNYGEILVIGQKDVENKRVSLGKEMLSPEEVRERFKTMVDTFA